MNNISSWIPFFKGGTKTEIINNTLRVKRFTDKQETYYNTHDMWKIRHKGCAGICIIFEGDITELKLSAKIDAKSRTYFGIDILTDGIITHSRTYETDETPESAWSDVFKFSKTGKPKKIEVLLPPLVRLSFTDIEVDAEINQVIDNRGHYLALGDSITQGIASKRPFMTYAQQVAKLLDKQLFNQGVGAHIFDVDSFDPSLDVEPELITIAYGINDWGLNIGLDEIKILANDYFKAIRDRWPNADIFAITPIWLNRVKPELADPIKFRQQIADAAIENDLKVIDGFSVFPHEAELLPDEIHPEAEGFMMYGHNVAKKITDALNK